MTPEQYAAARKMGHQKTLERAVKRGEDIDFLLDRAKLAQGATKKSLLSDPTFFKKIRSLNRGRSRSPTGQKANALVYFGLRPSDFSMPLGSYIRMELDAAWRA